MEVIDPFVPFQSNDGVYVELPEEWTSQFATMAVELPKEEDPQKDVTPTAASEPEKQSFASSPSFGAAVHTDNIGRSQELARTLAGALRDLDNSLSASEKERAEMTANRAKLQDRLRSLELEVAHKERFKEILLHGASSEVSYEDLQGMQSMTDALVQDPDRLTVLFNVVQQAGKLATMVTVYTELRHLAEEV